MRPECRLFQITHLSLFLSLSLARTQTDTDMSVRHCGVVESLYPAAAASYSIARFRITCEQLVIVRKLCSFEIETTILSHFHGLLHAGIGYDYILDSYRNLNCLNKFKSLLLISKLNTTVIFNPTKLSIENGNLVEIEWSMFAKNWKLALGAICAI
jgi:hypothetical protein